MVSCLFILLYQAELLPNNELDDGLRKETKHLIAFIYFFSDTHTMWKKFMGSQREETFQEVAVQHG